MNTYYCPKCQQEYEEPLDGYYCRECFYRKGVNVSLQQLKHKGDKKQILEEDKLLKKRVNISMREHLQLAREYERAKNVDGARQLRAVANLLGVLLSGGIPTTILPKGKK